MTGASVGEELAGLSIERYAGVSAALAEGIALSRILDQEQIDSATWPDAERTWREAIAESSELRVRFMQARRIAQDCLRRKIVPLDDDASAWVGLLGALAFENEPGGLLRRLGLTMNDVDRLGRHWRRRMEQEPQLAEELERLAPRAIAPPRVDVGPVELRAFPWTPSSRSLPGPTVLIQVEPAPPPTGPAPAPVRVLATFQRVPEPSEVDFDQTLPLVASGAAALPFLEGAAPVAPPPCELPDQSGETLAIAGAGALFRDLPFAPDGEPGDYMSLAVYVEMAASLRAAPQDADGIMKRFGLTTPEERQRVHGWWKTQFESNPELKHRFDVEVSQRSAKKRDTGPVGG